MEHWSSRAWALGVAASCLIAAATTPAVAQEGADANAVFLVETDLEPEIVTIDSDDRNRVVYDLVDDSLRVTSYDNTSVATPSRVDARFRQAILRDSDADLRFIIFADTDAIGDLSRAIRRRLVRWLETGTVILGAQGYGRDLKQELGLITSDLYDAGTTTGGPDSWVLLHRNAKGHLDELTIPAPTNQGTLQKAFHHARNWYERNKATVEEVDVLLVEDTDSDDDPWTAIHNFEWSDYIYGDFEGTDNETAGTYSFLLSVYFLDDAEDQDTDYYRFDFGTVVGISSYEMTGNDFGDTSGKCGWWNAKEVVAATITTSGGQWWRTGFMPDTTVGSTTTSFTIGGDISTSGPEGTAAYSQSYGTSDVTIEVFSNTVDEWLVWDATLVGCSNYEWYPDYDGASDAAKSTYSLDPSFIAAVPDDSTLAFTTTADSDADEWGFTVEKVKLDCGFACLTIDHKTYSSSYTNPISATCNTTACS